MYVLYLVKAEFMYVCYLVQNNDSLNINININIYIFALCNVV